MSYMIRPFNKGVELSSMYITEFVNGLVKLIEDGYTVHGNAVYNKLGMYFLYVEEGEIKELSSKEENQQIILLSQELQKTKEKLNNKIADIKDLKDQVKLLKYPKKEKE